MPKRILAAVFLAPIFAAAGATAQEPAPPAEFGCVSAGQIETITKQPRKLSGSFAITRSDSNLSNALKGTGFGAFGQ